MNKGTAMGMNERFQVLIGTMPGITNSIVEPNIDRTASNYILAHYGELVKAARKMGVHTDLCSDIVDDVYVSIYKDESNGKGYDPNKGTSVYITVEGFVYGRLKRYSLNKKYRNIDINARVAEYDAYGIVEIPACSTTDDLDSMTYYQRSYELAASYDDIEEIDLEVSVSEELEYILTFEGQVQLNLRYFLKNLGRLAALKIDVATLFKELKKLEDDEFMEALYSLMDFYRRSPDKYEALVASL